MKIAARVKFHQLRHYHISLALRALCKHLDKMTDGKFIDYESDPLSNKEFERIIKNSMHNLNGVILSSERRGAPILLECMEPHFGGFGPGQMVSFVAENLDDRNRVVYSEPKHRGIPPDMTVWPNTLPRLDRALENFKGFKRGEFIPIIGARSSTEGTRFVLGEVERMFKLKESDNKEPQS